MCAFTGELSSLGSATCDPCNGCQCPSGTSRGTDGTTCDPVSVYMYLNIYTVSSDSNSIQMYTCTCVHYITANKSYNVVSMSVKNILNCNNCYSMHFVIRQTTHYIIVL